MSKIFKIKLSKTKKETLNEASRLFKEQAVEHTITKDGGTFNGDGFAGLFTISDGHIEIEITKKPMLIPWFAIESKIKSYFE